MMGYYGYDGFSWIWMTVTMVIFWGGIVALAVWGIRSFTNPGRHGDQALDRLRSRFASGEINQEEFDRIKRALQG